MSDGGRERASLGAEVWKSSQKRSVRRSAVRSIAWLGRFHISIEPVELRIKVPVLRSNPIEKHCVMPFIRSDAFEPQCVWLVAEELLSVAGCALLFHNV
jgi:hypothetical protein